MFTITGALYTWGVKGSYQDSQYTLTLTQAPKPDLDIFTLLVSNELTKLDIELPTGKSKLKREGEQIQFEWQGSSHDVILKPNIKDAQAELIIKQASPLRFFVQLHKAKGAVFFKIYTTLFALSLSIIMATGLIMAWQVPRFKKLTAISLTTGLLSFIAIALLS